MSKTESHFTRWSRIIEKMPLTKAEKNTVHPLDRDAVKQLELDVRAISSRARRLGIHSVATTLECVAEAVEGVHEKMGSK